MSEHGDVSSPGTARCAAVRAAGFLALWLALAGADPADLPAVVVAVVAATWASLRLLPPSPRRLAPGGAAWFALHFLRQSVVGGMDVAWRAFDPRLPLRPGFVVYPVQLPSGPARYAFSALMSLVPGTTPAGLDESGGLVVHCLDIDQPVVEQLAAEETKFTRAWGGGG